METAKVNENLQIEVSEVIKNWLTADEELAAFVEGDMLVLKKMRYPRLSSIADKSSDKEMPLRQISEEVHRYRQQKKSRKSDGRR